MLAFLRFAQLLREMLARIDDTAPPRGMAELTKADDFARKARGALGVLYDETDLKARDKIVRAAARTIAALGETDAGEGQAKIHTYVTNEMKEAVWEVGQWFASEPQPCPWVD
jgi:hypothetical protein